MSINGNFGPRMPLHFQNAEIAKAAKDNPSYESFRPNVVHPTGSYNTGMTSGNDQRASIAPQSRVRRYPSGELDIPWTANQIVDAIHKLEYNGGTGDPNYGSASLLPLEEALLTVVFPMKYRKMEPMQAEILTQMSDSEKDAIRTFINAQFAAEENWNAGQGGGAVSGRMRRNVGG